MKLNEAIAGLRAETDYCCNTPKREKIEAVLAELRALRREKLRHFAEELRGKPIQSQTLGDYGRSITIPLSAMTANAHDLAEERSDDSQQRVVGGKVD